jgi:hypothetical protein
MNNLLTFIIGIYLIICPFYFFESGIPQPAHYVAAIAFIVMIFSKDFRLILKEKVVQYLVLFLIITIVVNSVYYFKYSSIGDGNIFLLHIAYYVFNFLFFILFLIALKQEHSIKNIDKIALFCLISIGIQVILAILGVDKVTQYIVTGRSVIYFNNPNQLGYFTLLMLTLFTILPSRYRNNKFIALLALVGSAILVVVSGSRLVLVGVVLLAFLLLFQQGIKLKLKYWVIISLVGLIFASFIYKTEFIQKRITLVEIRNHRQDSTGVSEAQIRGYDRIWLYPKNIIYGAGEGKYDRFLSYHQWEIHSGFGTILFSYGIIGMLFFMLFFYKVIVKRMFYNVLLLTPIIVYNLAHQGFRSPLFWAVLASVYVISQQIDKTTKRLI